MSTRHKLVVILELQLSEKFEYVISFSIPAVLIRKCDHLSPKSEDENVELAQIVYLRGKIEVEIRMWNQLFKCLQASH